MQGLFRWAARPSAETRLDIHIDELSEGLSDRSHWVTGGFELLEAAVSRAEGRASDCAICLVFHLNHDEEGTVGVVDPGVAWTAALGATPPELVIIRAADWNQHSEYFRDFGRVTGTIVVAGLRLNVYQTEREDRHGPVVERARHLWVVAEAHQRMHRAI